MDNKYVIKEFLNYIFLNLSNVQFKVKFTGDNSFKLTIVKKENCVCSYSDIKTTLNNDFVFDLNSYSDDDDGIYNISLKIAESDEKMSKNEFTFTYEIERKD